MASVLAILTVIFTVVLAPFLVFFCGIVILAALGKTLGVRRLYIRFLLKVFEVCIRRMACLLFIAHLKTNNFCHRDRGVPYDGFHLKYNITP